jgi:DNA-binding NarL/FixJ family response regulator
MAGEPRPTVVIAEDSGLLRESFAGMLARFGFDVVATVDDSVQLLAAVAEHGPRLVITDVRMPPTFHDEGLRAALEIRRRHRHVAVVVLSQYVEQTHAGKLLAEGDAGVAYLLKDRVADVRSLIGALRQVLSGETVVDPEVVRRLLARRSDPLTRLTTRERETLALMAQGRSNAAIARELVVTEATVAKHIRSLFDKLDLPPTTEHHRRVLAVLTYLQRDDAGA